MLMLNKLYNLYKISKNNSFIFPLLLVVTFQHGEHHDDHVLLQVEKLLQEVHLWSVLAKFVLHVREEEQEPAHSVPETGVGQGLLVANARSLDHLSQSVENLHSQPNCHKYFKVNTYDISMDSST